MSTTPTDGRVPFSVATSVPGVKRAAGVVATIVAVNDETPIVDLLHAILEEEGYRVRVAHNGREAMVIQNDAPVRVLFVTKTSLCETDKTGAKAVQGIAAFTAVSPIPILSLLISYSSSCILYSSTGSATMST